MNTPLISGVGGSKRFEYAYGAHTLEDKDKHARNQSKPAHKSHQHENHYHIGVEQIEPAEVGLAAVEHIVEAIVVAPGRLGGEIEQRCRKAGNGVGKSFGSDAVDLKRAVTQSPGILATLRAMSGG